MSNTSIGRAKKGSKFHMQDLVNSKDVNLLNNVLLNKSIKWLSPLAADSYREYSLNSDHLLSLLKQHGINLSKGNFSFWPSRQPQWDAIGVNDGVLYLVEAKAHVSETFTYKDTNPKSLGSQNNLKLILDTMKDTFNTLGGKGNFDSWVTDYYQVGNRLTFWNELNNLGIQTELVLLNFVGDEKYIPTNKNDWVQHYVDVFQKMIGQSVPPNGVKLLYYDVTSKAFV